VALRVGRGIAPLFHDRGTRRGKWSAASLGRTLPPGKTRYPLYGRLGGPQGRSGRAENLVPTGIRSRTVQPIVSRYNDCAIRPTKLGRIISNSFSINHRVSHDATYMSFIKSQMNKCCGNRGKESGRTPIKVEGSVSEPSGAAVKQTEVILSNMMR